MEKNGNGRGFIGEPRRTACTELAGNKTVVPDEAWAHDGEFDDAEPESGMDTGIFIDDPHDPEVHHVDRENLPEEDFYPDRDGSEGIASQEEREAKRRDSGAMLKAGKNLLLMLYGLADDSVSMEEFESSTTTNTIIACYLRKRMDGVISYYFDNRYDGAIIEDILEFCRKMFQYQPQVSRETMTDSVMKAKEEMKVKEEVGPNGGNGSNSVNLRDIINLPISSKAKAKLISRAQWEQSRHYNHNGNKPASRLGEAIFGNRWQRFLRA